MGPSSEQHDGSTTKPSGTHWEYVSWDAIQQRAELPASVCEFLRGLNISCYQKVVGGVAEGYLCTTPPGPLDDRRKTLPTVGRAAQEALNDHWDAVEHAVDTLTEFLRDEKAAS